MQILQPGATHRVMQVCKQYVEPEIAAVNTWDQPLSVRYTPERRQLLVVDPQDGVCAYDLRMPGRALKMLRCCLQPSWPRPDLGTAVGGMTATDPHRCIHCLTSTNLGASCTACKCARLLCAPGKPVWESRQRSGNCTLVVPPASPGVCLLVAAPPASDPLRASRLDVFDTAKTQLKVFSTVDGELLASHSGSASAIRQQPFGHGPAVHASGVSLHRRAPDGASRVCFKQDSRQIKASQQQGVGLPADCFAAAAAVAGRLAVSSSCAVGVQLLQMPPYERRVPP
jgi:hypothetical protein